MNTLPLRERKTKYWDGWGKEKTVEKNIEKEITKENTYASR